LQGENFEDIDTINIEDNDIKINSEKSLILPLIKSERLDKLFDVEFLFFSYLYVKNNFRRNI
jgi:hypothetical protein